MSIAHQIASVQENSVAHRAGIEPMDIIKSLNGVELKDIFDYYYYSDESSLDVVIEKPDHRLCSVHIEKEEGQDLGITNPATTSVCFVLLTRCHRGCGILYILRMMIPDYLFYREIM